MANPASRPGRPDWLAWVALAVCAAAVWAVFGGVRDFSFVLWDDDHNLQQNPHLGVTWENLRWMFTDTGYVRRYIPLAWLGWSLDHDLFGLTPRSAHLGNLLFHLLNTALVFLVIRSVARIWPARETGSDPWPANVAAALGALLWALHPLRAEVVAWSSARIYAQSACFILLSLLCYLRSVESTPGSVRARNLRWASVVALALSLLTYPLALSYVGILLVLDWYRPGRPAAPEISWGARLRTVLVDKIPFFAVTAVLLGVTLCARTNVQAVGWKPPVTLEQFGAVPRFLQACYVWAYYLWKPLLPFHLSPYYTRLVSFSPGDWEFIVSLALVGLVTGALFWRRQRWPGVWLLWLCHLLVLLPVLGLTEHPHFTNDRYSYVAAVPWAVAIAVLILRLWPRRALRFTALLVAGAVIVTASALSLQQAAIWWNTEALGLHMVAELGDHPRRFEIYSRMATSLRAEGRLAESNAYYLKSLAGDPAAADRALQQARKLEAAGQLREAFPQYLLASQLRPDLAEPKFRLGTILMQQDRAAEALPFLQDAVRLEPGSADIQISLGWALNWTNQSPAAIPHLEAGLRLQPDDVAGHSGLGTALLAIGQPREALAHFEEIIRLNPNAAVAHMQRGLALLDGLGRKADAAAEFETVLRLQPDFPGARAALDRARR